MKSRYTRATHAICATRANRTTRVNRTTRAFTLIELLIAVSIIAVMLIMVIFLLPKFINRSRDGVRKAHLEKYRVAFEEYFSDFNRYPPADMLQECGGQVLQPYLPEVYCDPLTDDPYYYETNELGTTYSIFTTLAADDDPVIAQRGCTSGCGPDLDDDGNGDYNYGISSFQSVGGGADTTVAATCGGQTGAPFCFPGVCSECCPGDYYRCNASGTGCYIDLACEEL